jgi:Major Facilitator Superfamily
MHRLVTITRCEQVIDGGGREPGGREPRGSAPVQLGESLGDGAPRFEQQHVAEQVVVAVPLPDSVEPDHQLVLRGELGEPAGAVVRAGDRVQQHPREAVQDRRLDHPSPFVPIQHGEQLVGEIPDHQLIVTPELFDEAIGVLGPLERQPGEHQSGCPPFGPLAQIVEVPGVQPLGRRPEEGSGFGGVESQVGGPNLVEPPADAHPAQPERRIGACDQHDGELRRAQLDEAFDVAVHVRVVDEVVVVEHDDQLGARSGGTLRSAVAYVRDRPDVRGPLMIMAVVGLVVLNFQTTFPSLVRFGFDRGAGAVGTAMSVSAIGSILGGVYAAGIGSATRRTLVVVLAGFGLALVAAAAAPTYLAFVVLGIPLGFASACFQSVDTVAVQQATDPSMHGRVMALHQMAWYGSTPIGALAMGWVIQATSPRAPFAIGATAALACAATVAHGLRGHVGRDAAQPAPA